MEFYCKLDRPLRAYNFEDLSDVTIAAEDQGIISFSLDDTDTYALVNVDHFFPMLFYF